MGHDWVALVSIHDTQTWVNNILRLLKNLHKNGNKTIKNVLSLINLPFKRGCWRA
jgi:hypothetical protein